MISWCHGAQLLFFYLKFIDFLLYFCLHCVYYCLILSPFFLRSSPFAEVINILNSITILSRGIEGIGDLKFFRSIGRVHVLKLSHKGYGIIYTCKLSKKAIQRHAARYVMSDYERHSSVSNMISTLNWKSLKQRRDIQSLCIFWCWCHTTHLLDFQSVTQ